MAELSGMQKKIYDYIALCIKEQGKHTSSAADFTKHLNLKCLYKYITYRIKCKYIFSENAINPPKFRGIYQSFCVFTFQPQLFPAPRY